MQFEYFLEELVSKIEARENFNYLSAGAPGKNAK